MVVHSEVLQETQSDISKLRFEAIIRDSVIEIERGLDDYNTNLLLLIDAILLAKQGILHPAILSPDQLLTSAQKIKETLVYEFPLTPEELLTEQIEKITNLNVIFTRGRILFELTIPLLERKTYSLYKIYPCPSTHDIEGKTVISYIQPQIQYIAVSSDEQQYFSPTEEYLKTCRFHHNQLLGPATLPVYQADRQPTCESTLLLNPASINWNSCTIKLTTQVKPYWQTLNTPTTWLYFMPENKKAQIYCKGKKSITRNITAIGIFKLQPGCQATIDSVQLKSLETIDTSQNIEYYPAKPYNLSIIIPEITEHHLEVLKMNEQKPTKWEDLPTALSLTEIEQRARNFATHQTSIRQVQVSTFSSIGGIIVILIIVNTILVMKCKPRQLNNKTESPKREPRNNNKYTKHI